MNESPGTLELLSSRVDELEKRVHALEHPDEAKAYAVQPRVTQASAAFVDGESDLQAVSLFPLIGRAMLGIAGAYVLRAIAAADVLPRLPISALAAAYAFAWLFWSSRSPRRLSRIAYSATSALILAPMLWEMTLQFHVFSSMASAGILSAFLLLATIFDVRSGNTQTMWVAQSVATISAAALAFATHQVLAFLAALLVAAFVVECAKMLRYAQPAWPLIALVADAATWAMIFIYSGSQSARTEFPDLSVAALIVPACLLFGIYGTSIAVEVFHHQKRITIFAVIQTMIAFLTAASAVLYFAPKSGPKVLGVFCLTLSAIIYAGTFRYLRLLEDRRNLTVVSSWSAALLLAGSLWALPRPETAMLLAVAGVAAIWLAPRIESEILELQSDVFLLAAAIVAGLPQYVFNVVAGSLPYRPALSAMVVCACTGAAYLVERETTSSSLWRTILRFIPALLAMCALVALLVHGVLGVASLAMSLDVHHIAFLRTLTICLASLCMAFGGSRWGRVELTRLAYVALAFVAAKLIFEDLRHGHMEFSAASIALFAIALIAVPRLVRLGNKLHGAVVTEPLAHSGR
jgi:uncharacterized membrane protein YsdA (DUF1294 family)